MTKLIVLRGYPGSGKTTIGKALERSGGGVFIDHNQLLTFITKFTRNDDGIYKEIAQLEQAMTDKLLNDGKSVIVARGFSSKNSLQKYVDIAKKHKVELYVIRLEVSNENLAHRVQASERKLDFNPTTSKKSLNDWITNNPLEDYPGEIVVDSNADLDTVTSKIKKLTSINSFR